MKKIKANQEVRLSNIHSRVLMDLLHDLGHNEEAIFSGISLQPELLTTPDLEVTYSQYVELVRQAIKLTNNTAIGLLFGKKLNGTGHGLFGLGAMASDNLMKSIEFADQAAMILNPAIGYHMEDGNDYFHIEIRELMPWEDLTPYMVDTSFSMINALLKNGTGQNSLGIKYQFNYDVDSSKQDYHDMLGPHLEFNAESNRISIPSAIATHPSPWRNPIIAEQINQQLSENIKQKDHEQNKLVAPIKELLFKTPGSIPSLDEIADHFSLSPRTLSRRLKTLHTSYNDILNEERKRLALQYMNDPDYSVDKIAYLLGYHNSSNFSKAFKGWTSHTPRDYRKHVLNQ